MRNRHPRCRTIAVLGTRDTENPICQRKGKVSGSLSETVVLKTRGLNERDHLAVRQEYTEPSHYEAQVLTLTIADAESLSGT